MASVKENESKYHYQSLIPQTSLQSNLKACNLRADSTTQENYLKYQPLKGAWFIVLNRRRSPTKGYYYITKHNVARRQMVDVFIRNAARSGGCTKMNTRKNQVCFRSRKQLSLM